MSDRAKPGSRAAGAAIWGALGLVLAFLYAPLVPPVLKSFQGAGDDWFMHYRAILSDPLLIASIGNTLAIGAIVAVTAPLMALGIAQAIREWSRPRLILGLVLLPLFVPGVSMGVATAIFFRFLGIEPSLLSMCVVQILWALPFATLIIMTSMASFERSLTEAAHMLGAGPLAAFADIELPHLRGALLGAAAFSLILSLNETIRTSIVQGGRNTVQTYLWSQYQQVGLDPSMNALMAMLTLITFALLAIAAVSTRR